MMTETKLVDFHKYCLECRHVKKDGTEEPCNECLASPANINSRKPVNFEKK